MESPKTEQDPPPSGPEIATEAGREEQQRSRRTEALAERARARRERREADSDD